MFMLQQDFFFLLLNFFLFIYRLINCVASALEVSATWNNTCVFLTQFPIKLSWNCSWNMGTLGNNIQNIYWYGKKIFCFSIFGPHLFNILYCRVTKPLDCPVCDKQRLVRLDKHLLDIHAMNAEVSENVQWQWKSIYLSMHTNSCKCNLKS